MTEVEESLPRERMLRQGSDEGLSDAELLAIVLGRGTAGCGVRELAFRIITAFGSLFRLTACNWLELKAGIETYNEKHPLEPIKGLGETRLVQLAAAFALVRRGAAEMRGFREYNLRSSQAAYRVFAKIVAAAPEKEHFFVLPMDASYHALCEPIDVSQGSVSRSPVHPRDVFCEAIRYRAWAIMVAHNHPSGDPTPSEEDVEVTQRLLEVGRLHCIPVIDHLVLGARESNNGQGYVSLRNLGELDWSGGR